LCKPSRKPLNALIGGVFPYFIPNLTAADSIPILVALAKYFAVFKVAISTIDPIAASAVFTG